MSNLALDAGTWQNSTDFSRCINKPNTTDMMTQTTRLFLKGPQLYLISRSLPLRVANTPVGSISRFWLCHYNPYCQQCKQVEGREGVHSIQMDPRAYTLSDDFISEVNRRMHKIKELQGSWCFRCFVEVMMARQMLKWCILRMNNVCAFWVKMSPFE